MPHADEKFRKLALWDGGEYTGPHHMACDEAMLRGAKFPILRWYRWAQHEVSFGYPMRWRDVQKSASGRPAVRRWTGGGLVEHGEDLTLAISVPTQHCRDTPTAFYERIHRAIADTLGPNVRLANADECSCGEACFDNPARFDVLRDRRKIVGGALRRTREATLYQGSIQAVAIPPDFIPRLAAHLAETSAPWQPDEATHELVTTLRDTKYATSTWLARR